MRFFGAAVQALLTLSLQSFVQAQSLSPDTLVKAYPDHLVSQDGKSILWRDGTRQPISDGTAKSFEVKLRNASLSDQLSIPYPRGPRFDPPGPEEDPGRFRNQTFFDKMYGNCEKGEVQKHLITFTWIGGQKLRATTINNVADRLRQIAVELDKLPAPIKKLTYPSAGTFSCRNVKDTGQRSMHAYGAALDISTKFSDYWLWSKVGYRNRIPYEIVEAFEKQGFIWGGKWGHFDTMHFEYRPEFFIEPLSASPDNKSH